MYEIKNLPSLLSPSLSMGRPYMEEIRFRIINF